MKDITSPRVLLLKALLLVLAGMLAAAVLIEREPRATTVILIIVVAWSFARVYYFAFYVISRYIDSRYRFSGVVSAGVFLWRRCTRNRPGG